MKDELDRWFVSEVLPQEGALTRYLSRAWSNAADVLDLRQEVYMRVYQSSMEQRPQSARAYVITVARNLLTDRIRRDRRVSMESVQELDDSIVPRDELTPERYLSAEEDLRKLSVALERLPQDCRSVIWLRRVEGLTQREAAQRLGMAEGTLESHLCRGVRALADAVFGDAHCP